MFFFFTIVNLNCSKGVVQLKIVMIFIVKRIPGVSQDFILYMLKLLKHIFKNMKMITVFPVLLSVPLIVAISLADHYTGILHYIYYYL